jgi:hypothetical protein
MSAHYLQLVRGLCGYCLRVCALHINGLLDLDSIAWQGTTFPATALVASV